MNTILQLSGQYNSCKESIKKLIKDINMQLNKKRVFQLGAKCIDLRKLKYIDSNLSVVIFAYIKSLQNMSKISSGDEYKILPPDFEPLKIHLLKNNFCSLWQEDCHVDINGTIIKISEYKNAKQGVESVLSDFYPMFSGLQMREDDIYQFAQYLSEVINNCFQHGNSDTVYFSGQFFPTKHELDVTMLNFGTTFKDNIKLYIDDMKCISWAFQFGTTTSNSLGLGMYSFLTLIKKYNAEIVILSDNEIYTNENGCEKDEIHPDVYFGGTLINIKFKLNEYNIIKKY